MNTNKRVDIFIEIVEFQRTRGKKADECHKNVMLVWCGGIYLVFGGRFWKKKAPLGAHEIHTKFTGKMEGGG
ncbi:MAG: hypothetical protein NTW92_06435 [Bacteroidetes bacterium]|nr:hypothetical protein [Bacteroidota bacterium]